MLAIARRLIPITLLGLTFPVIATCDDGGGQPDPPRGATATFTSGVAAGDVRVTGAVLWTRAEGGDNVTAEISTDPEITKDVRKIGARTSSDRDFIVRVETDNLKPGTPHYYRFRAGDALSPVGAFTTAPPFTDNAPLRFVFSGDSDGRRDPAGAPVFNEFEVLDAAAREDPAFFLYFGDTIYADRDPVAETVDEYRAKYRLNRAYRALTDLLAKTSVYVMWDDHEVVNDFAGATADPARIKAGRTAFQDYWPMEPAADAAVMYRSFRWGSSVELFIIDGRSFRDAPATSACRVGETLDPLPAFGAAGAPETARAARGFVGLPEEAPAGCTDALEDPARTMLGAEQKAWLKQRLLDAETAWKVVVNPVPVQALALQPYDRWEGYAAERREILSFIRDNSIKNVLFLTTDFHANIFGPVRIDPFVDTTPVAYEAVAGPIATDTFYEEVVGAAGEGAAGAVAPFFTGVIGVDCAELDAYAYGVVAVDASGTLTVQAKDAQGTVLCNKTLELQL